MGEEGSNISVSRVLVFATTTVPVPLKTMMPEGALLVIGLMCAMTIKAQNRMGAQLTQSCAIFRLLGVAATSQVAMIVSAVRSTTTSTMKSLALAGGSSMTPAPTTLTLRDAWVGACSLDAA